MLLKKLYRLSAFPKGDIGGNNAGVYLYADDLSENEMQQIAKDVGYSETAFVMKSMLADFKVRFFTPISEVDLCGHATIATFNLLKKLKIVEVGTYTQETKVGILKLDVRENMVFMEQPQPIFSEMIDKKEIFECFDNIQLHPSLPIQVVSTGIREIFLPVESVDNLNSLKPDFKKMQKLAKQHDTIGIHAFAIGDDCDAYGRNFAPVVGIDEESATGTSNGALSCYLFRYLNKKSSFELRQGYSMNLPSKIIVNLEIDKDNINKVWVGGSANLIEK